MIDKNKLLENLEEMILEGKQYASADNNHEYGSYSTHEQYHKIFGWLTTACFSVNSILGDENHIYYKRIKLQLDALSNYNNAAYVNAGAALNVLMRFQYDLNKGLIDTLESKITAENFDDFLGHAEVYFNEGKKMESGVISGVVFEDTVRKICKKLGIEEKDQKLENLINALKSSGHIEKTKASRCKTAAAVRGSATHANQDDLDINSVRDTIALTRELLGEFLER
ncbi:MAG: hypothetical protein PHX61_01160 [Alphaproteobacteria bacterium]|nr:hypothetical protein [Alphaproteobacteria bacterium]